MKAVMSEVRVPGMMMMGFFFLRESRGFLSEVEFGSWLSGVAGVRLGVSKVDGGGGET